MYTLLTISYIQHITTCTASTINVHQIQPNTPPYTAYSIFRNAAAQEMADQEKQLLLEALEEKQKQREQEAQLQEKMLQQLKASGACVGSWVKHGGSRTIKYNKAFCKLFLEHCAVVYHPVCHINHSYWRISIVQWLGEDDALTPRIQKHGLTIGQLDH